MAAYSYPATLEPDEDGRVVVRFPALPEALTDGADQAEALREAVDCLSEALASRIVDGEEIPAPGPAAAGQYLVLPDPTIALKAALHQAMRANDMTVADLAERLGLKDWHQAARLIDPRRRSKLTKLDAALAALGLRVAVAVEPALPPERVRFVTVEFEAAPAPPPVEVAVDRQRDEIPGEIHQTERREMRPRSQSHVGDAGRWALPPRPPRKKTRRIRHPLAKHDDT